MENLVKALEYKYGPCFSVGSVVTVRPSCDEIEQTDKDFVLKTISEHTTEKLKSRKGNNREFKEIAEKNVSEYLIPTEHIIELIEIDGDLIEIVIPQIYADSHKLSYDATAVEMAIIGWNHESIKQPTEAQIKKDVAEYEKFIISQEYKEKRAAKYPSIEDQLDALWKGGTEAEAMKKQIEGIKKKYPKK